MKKENKYTSPEEGEGTRRVGEGEKKENSLLCPLIRALPTFSLRGRRHSGFTLIELLVVVLIIGILAAIALPQYEKTVEKSKSAQAYTLLKSIYDSAVVYYMNNGSWPANLDDLEVQVPWTGNTKWASEGENARSNEDWSCQLFRQGNNDRVAGVMLGRISGKYAGAGLVKWFRYTGDGFASIMPQQEIVCAERVSSGITLSDKLPAGTYCQGILNGQWLLTGSSRYYKLP